MPRPEGFAWLAQEIFADDYRGTTVTFDGQFRTPDATGRAGLFLRVMKPCDLHGPFTAQAALADRPTTSSPSKLPVTGPPTKSPRRSLIGANTVAFGLFLAGPGRIELRDPELTRDRLALLAT